jgi:tripartite ATP-independent transporter DctP family solute receptor
MLTRRKALAAGAATLGAATPLRFARAAEFTFKWGTNVPESHPLNLHAREAIAQLTNETSGRVELQLFANNTLGGDSYMFTQLRTGALECFSLSGVNVLSTLIPGASIWGVGFAWKDYPTLWSALDGKLGDSLRAQIRKAGLEVLDKVWDNGFREVTTSTRPIHTPDDFKGLKIRVPVSALWTSLFQSLGASPTSINFAEVYSSLQTKVVDAQENPPAIISAAKLYEVQKYCSMLNHMWDGWWFLMNRRAWASMPPDLQQTFSRIINASAMAERATIEKQNQELKVQLAADGLIFNDVDPAPFRAKLTDSGFYKSWKEKFGPEQWALLEQFTGPLA